VQVTHFFVTRLVVGLYASNIDSAHFYSVNCNASLFIADFVDGSIRTSDVGDGPSVICL